MPLPPAVALPAARDAAAGFAAMAAEVVALGSVLGATAAADVVAPAALPGFDAAAMDGFAVRGDDTSGAGPGAPVALRLAGESRAGRGAAGPLPSGAALRISTGAPLPAGADAVVRVEEATEEDGRVLVRRESAGGRDVRRAGEDVAAGEVVLRAGDRVGPGTIALLAGLGIATLAVHRAPRAVVVVTGDEVARPGGGPLRAAMVHDVHGVAVPALLTAAGAGSVALVRVGDDAGAIADALRATDADVVVTCGGMSVGRHDHVRRALEAVGARTLVPAVAMRPGAPTWIGERDGRPHVGLPGTPAAAMVATVLFACPAVRALAGGASPGRPGRLAEPVTRDARRHLVLWASGEAGDDGVLRVRPAAEQQSHRLRPPAGADVLVIVPPGADVLEEDALVEVLPIPGATPP